MENTSNYGLKRWDGEDRILHTEFNDNWDKIDTAIKGNADKAAAALAAARYIVAGEAKKLFSFSLTPEACKQLDQVTEAFLMTQQERGFRTLDYYKQLRRQSFS